MHDRCAFETFISPPFLKQLIYDSLLHVAKPQIKIISFQDGEHGCLMQYLIRQRFEGYCCESELKKDIYKMIKKIIKSFKSTASKIKNPRSFSTSLQV